MIVYKPVSKKPRAVRAQQARIAKQEMAQRAKAYPIIQYWREPPGIGPIRAMAILNPSEYALAIQNAKETVEVLWRWLADKS
jgi:hypothetical protein